MDKNRIDIIKKAVNSSHEVINFAQYRHAAVTIPLVEHNQELCIVFEKRSENIRQGGEISLPGGKVDVDDNSPEHTAIRETCEELNICEENIEIIGKFGSIITRINYFVEVYPALLHDIELETLDFNKSEVERIFIIPLHYFITTKPKAFTIESSYNFYDEEIFSYIPLPPKYRTQWNDKSHKVYVYPYSDDCVIWGLTAEIIYEFTSNIQSIIPKGEYF